METRKVLCINFKGVYKLKEGLSQWSHGLNCQSTMSLDSEIKMTKSLENEHTKGMDKT